MIQSIRIATRQSRLALWQTEYVADTLRRAHPGIEIEIIPMTTRGDEILDRSLSKVGGKGLFIKELEVAMIEDRADIAVHSMKDVPWDLPEGMRIGAVLQRADPGDAIAAKPGLDSLDKLPEGARVGTSSLRRQAQIRHVRPDLVVEPVRGNVETRLRKLDEGHRRVPSRRRSGHHRHRVQVVRRRGARGAARHRAYEDPLLPRRGAQRRRAAERQLRIAHRRLR